jgi:hypothetical protein
MDYDKIRTAAFDISASTIIEKFTLLARGILLDVLEIHFKDQGSTWRGPVEKTQRWLGDCYRMEQPQIYNRDFKAWVRRLVRGEIKPVR